MAEKIPKHVAIIPDGNRRWARANGKSVMYGHKAGTERFREISRHAADRGVKYLSAWGLSLENAKKRGPAEIAGLMKIFRAQFQDLQTSEDIHTRKVKINVIGRWREKFPAVVKKEIEKAIEATRDYEDYFLNFFLAYNGTDEMVQAIQEMVEEVTNPPTPRESRSATLAGESAGRITGETIKRHLFTKDLPPVDLVIRTGGEPHLSAGFMMWDVADAELYFPEANWPDFTPAEFDKALDFYSARERRFGK